MNIIHFYDILIWYYDILIVHIICAILLFFIVNFFGKHSKGFGYVEISLFAQDDESPAFNYLFRVLTPIVFLIIFATIYDAIGYPRYKSEIYLICIYYIIFRFLFNMLQGKLRLLNWRKVPLYWFSIIVLSYLAHISLLKNHNLLPDFNNISNEIWFLIIIFLYQIFNKYEPKNEGFEERKIKYIICNYEKYSDKYGKHIDALIENEIIKSIVYSIMIYESFNRPKYARIIETIKLKIKGEATLGIMQVKTKKYIDDETSIQMAVKYLQKRLNFLFTDILNKRYRYNNERDLIFTLLEKYNGYRYANEVSSIHEIIFLRYYLGTKSKLLPKELEEYLESGKINLKKDIKKDEKKL